ARFSGAAATSFCERNELRAVTELREVQTFPPPSPRRPRMVRLCRDFPPPSAHRLSSTDPHDPSRGSFPALASLLPQSGGLRARGLWLETLTPTRRGQRPRLQLAFSLARVFS